MDPVVTTLLSFLQSNQPTMLAQLHQFCHINSGTEHLAGIARMCQALQQAFLPIADEITSKKAKPISTLTMQGQTQLQTYGDMLFIRKRPHLKHRVLLTGHMDTVYSATHPFQSLRYLNDHEINGPGVADMKGGLIVMLHALMAFEQSPIAQHLGWDVFINSDEEVGSPASSAIFAELAPHYQTALVYEPAMSAQGMLAKNRRGSGHFTVIATGKAAHVGRAFNEGRNAICYLAEAITAIHALNGLRQGVNINVGLVAGGDALNMVPAQAVAKLDVRISHKDDELWVHQQLEHIITTLQRPDFALNIQGHFHRPVKQVSAATQALFTQAQEAGKALGVNIDWQDSGGCCDGNNLAQHGLAVLDTLGVRGGDIHSEREFIWVDSLVERAALSALLLIQLAKGLS